jgi:ribosomal subunit interface protein
MTLRISGKNLDIGEAMRTHVRERIDTAVAKYFPGSVSGHVTIEPEGSGYRADCTLHLTSGITLQADAKAQEPYASFDQAAMRIEKRLRRYKSRLKTHQSGVGEGVGEGEMVAKYILEAPADDDQEVVHDFSPAVISETVYRLKELSVSSAVMDLDLTGAPVLVFRHAGNGRVNIVYRRSDGNIGWIDPSTVGTDSKEKARV